MIELLIFGLVLLSVICLWLLIEGRKNPKFEKVCQDNFVNIGVGQNLRKKIFTFFCHESLQKKKANLAKKALISASAGVTL